MRELSKLAVLSLNMQSWKDLLVSNCSFGCVKSRERAHMPMMNLKGIVVQIGMSHESVQHSRRKRLSNQSVSHPFCKFRISTWL